VLIVASVVAPELTSTSTLFKFQAGTIGTIHQNTSWNNF
jgi:hypothetical protein